MAQKAILLIIDGLGDLPISSLSGKTPLQKAKKPNISKLASSGIQGLMSVVGNGIVPGSDVAHLQILGYEPEKYYSGRGPLEALGAGIKLMDGDVAFRANFATASGNKIIDRRAGRIPSSVARKLEKECNMRINGVQIIFKATSEHRGAIVLRGTGLSANVSPTDSHYLGALRFSAPLDNTPEAKKTARILNTFTKIVRARLERNKINIERKQKNLQIANIIIARGSGMFKNIIKFNEMHGITGACIAGGALYKGIARYIGMNVIDVLGATGTKDTNLRAKGHAVQKALDQYDFVFVHVKATDSFSHDGDSKGKCKFIERIDSELIPLLKKTECTIIITGDHSTSCARKCHTGYEVPILIYEKGGRSDSLKKFDEISAMNGGLGHIQGKDVMPIILNILGKARMHGS
ncbi:MAG: 2,3-bisphosphoglycerate-independent phosphoglycerate mutase [Candidatus Micrarchaeota archaeon]